MAGVELEGQREVQALLDIPRVSTKRGSGVVERLQEKQRERHEQLVAELQKELSAISERLESEVRDSGEQLKQKLESSLHNMEAALATITNCDHLSSLRLEDLEGVWQRVESQFDLRLGFIETLGKELAAVEGQRSEKVCKCLQNFTQVLVGVAYCSEGEVARQVEREAHSLNMTSLSNRRSAAQLCSQLAAGERRVCGEMRDRWREAVERWRKKVLQDTLLKFRAAIGVDEGQKGVGEVERWRGEGERVKREMIEELSRLQRRKLELLTQLSSLGPSPVVMEMLHRLEESAREVDQQISGCVQRGLLRLGQTGEQLVGVCEREMEVCQRKLLDSGVCDDSSVYQVLMSDYLPLTERLAQQGRNELQNIEMAVEAHIAQHQSWFQSILQYGMGAAQLWRDHSSALTEVKRSREEVLERLRVQHDIKNQNGEANLDIVLDHMRQAPNEQVLDKCLEEANALLEVISGGYKEFQEVVLQEVRSGPGAVDQCLLDYDTALCGYLGVTRQPPASPKNRKGKVASRARAGSKRSKKTTPTGVTSQPSLAGMVEEVVVGGGAVRFYVVGGAENEGDTPGVFLTQSEENEGAPHGIANQAFPLSRDRYTQARASLRAVYLEHLEVWGGEVRSEEEREAKEKEGEAHGELELRLHLHRPRQTRITQDIQRVRAAELEAHRDRAGRHARAVVTGISDVRASAQTVSDAMKTEEADFCREMESLSQSLAGITSSVGLQQVEKKAKQLLEKRLQKVEKIASDLQLTIETSLSDLTSANTAFSASLKLFSEAGNYCPEEVELFSHKLDRLATKLSTVHPQVTATVAQASTEHSLTARNTFSHFQNKYHLHWTDVCYLEEVKRLLTNLQLSIRSVVANSNLQASKLHDDITRLQNQLESGDHAHFLEGVPLLITLLSQRMVYLHCRATVQQGGRVGPTLRQGGRVGSQQKQPISAVNVSQSIRDHTRASGCQLPPATSSTSGQPPPSRTEGRNLSRRKAVALVERKNVNFGVGGGEDGSCFLPQIRALLSSSYSRLYATTEAYYTGKGGRAVECQLLAASCEEALDKLIETCQTFRRQCEDYRNNAISEFRGQLEVLLSLLVGVAPLEMGGVKAAHLGGWQLERRELEASHHEAMQELAEKKLLHEKALVPGLGHPAASQQLQDLSCAEQQRHRCCQEQIRSHSADLQMCVRKVSRELAAELVSKTQSLLAVLDSVPTTNEVIPGNEDTPEQLPVDQLLRLKLRPADEVKEEGVAPSSSQARQWPGLSSHLLGRLGLDSEEMAELSRELSSRKTSEAHQAAITARDRALEEFVVCVEEEVGVREREEGEERGREERWQEHWTQSLRSLTELYS